MSDIEIERRLPLIASLAMIMITFYFQIPLDIPVSDRATFLGAAVSIGAVFAGFLTGAMAMIMSISKEREVDLLRISGYLPILRNYMSSGIVASIFFCLISMLGFLSPVKNAVIFKLFIYPSVFIGALIYALLTFYRSAKMLTMLIK